jgi:hypothetical protein
MEHVWAFLSLELRFQDQDCVGSKSLNSHCVYHKNDNNSLIEGTTGNLKTNGDVEKVT